MLKNIDSFNVIKSSSASAEGAGYCTGSDMATAEHSVNLIEAILRALVKWCLKHGVRSAQVEEIVRRAFVQQAECEIR
jgi:hypothetical protein